MTLLENPGAVVAASAYAAAAATPAGSSPATLLVSEDPARLLIVSDSRLAPDQLRAVQATGFDYDFCDVPQTVAVLKSNAYHAALFNLQCPDRAFALIAQVRSIPYFRQVPIVAFADHANLNSAFRAGASFAVPRPVAPDLLENTLGAIYRIAIGLRRQYYRYRVELPLALLLDGRAIEAKATDIGTGGMALVAAEPLESGAIVTARFVLPGTEEQITVLGEIRWTDHQGRAGFCFNSIAEAGRTSLDNWTAGRHTPVEPSAPPARTAIASAPAALDASSEGTRNAGKIAIAGFLIAFSLFMIGFWVYIALTS